MEMPCESAATGRRASSSKTRYARRGACGAASASVAAGCMVGGRVEYDCVSDASLLSPNLHAFTPTFPTQTLTHIDASSQAEQALDAACEDQGFREFTENVLNILDPKP